MSDGTRDVTKTMCVKGVRSCSDGPVPPPKPVRKIITHIALQSSCVETWTQTRLYIGDSQQLAFLPTMLSYYYYYNIPTAVSVDKCQELSGQGRF